MDNVKVIGSFLILAVAAVLIYQVWSISTDKPVYGRMGKPSLPVIIYMAATAIAALLGAAVVFTL